MKRTEKVEIRVSLEEKQTLSNLAKLEGESVSGLIRGLIEKYMALNAASSKRRLPKWQLAALLLTAVFIGHGLTLIPMHLHDRGHQSADASKPVYYVHGAINKSAFGVSVSAGKPEQALELDIGDGATVLMTLAFQSAPNKTGLLNISICETNLPEMCAPVLLTQMEIDRIAPSVLGSRTPSGLPVHIFAQEMASGNGSESPLKQPRRRVQL